MILPLLLLSSLLLTRTRADPLCAAQCNADGTRTCEEGICTCKSNVIGADCSACRHGTVDMDGANEVGCAECFCMGHSPSCSLQSWAVSYVSEAFEATRGEGWSVVSATSNLTSLNLERTFDESAEYISFTRVRQDLRSDNFYWVLPARHLGDWLSSYGSELRYTLNLHCSSDFSCSFNQLPWVILTGGIMQDLKTVQFYIFENVREKWKGLKQIRIPIHEGYTIRTCWRNPDRKCEDRSTLLQVLSNVVEVRVKAGIFRTSYNMAIGAFQRQIASHSGQERKRVEVCACPDPYQGSSCHLCKPGLWHKAGWGCEKCECNNYSYTCDSFTGKCRNCAYDTACANCDCCADGFYGKPDGFPNPCTPCPCNGRAGICTSNEDGSFGECIGCKDGYTGRNCELCDDGFYGNPSAGIACTRCHCSGNIDPTVKGNCHNTTGECYNCLHRTAGFSCQRCERGYFGDATTQSCQQCRCNLIGAKDNICDSETGKCVCKDNVIGSTCNKCADQTYGFPEGDGCKPCDCDTTGTVFGSNECDPRTGQCPCRVDRQYQKCEGCVNGYFLNKEGRCVGCNCPAARTLTYSCNGVTGDCYCTAKYTGSRCEQAACLKGPWSDWTPCNKPCGNGTQTRTRRIFVPDQDVMAIEGLPAEQCDALESEQRPCNSSPCTFDTAAECRVVHVLAPLSHGHCRTRRHHEIARCSGTCAHPDIDCCQPYLLTQQVYTLHCADGSRVGHSFDLVKQCGCLSC